MVTLPITKTRPAITTSTNNPAGRIHDQYKALMTITDLDTLKTQVLELAKPGSGISPKNATKFANTVKNSTSLSRLQAYLTNFILAADGMNVIR